MKPWVELVIEVDGDLLMSSRQHGSEEALARIGGAGLGPAPRVLVVGLGMVMGRMRRAGLAPEAHAARAVGRSGGVHTIYVGRTDGSGALPRK